MDIKVGLKVYFVPVTWRNPCHWTEIVEVDETHYTLANGHKIPLGKTSNEWGGMFRSYHHWTQEKIKRAYK